MVFRIILAPEAVSDLRRLRAPKRSALRDAMSRHLSHEPTKISKTRIKRLRGVARPQHRLRVGDVRVFYDVEGQSVHVLGIVERQKANEWLGEAGKTK
jgi:mRNA interferase RelE/StbE